MAAPALRSAEPGRRRQAPQTAETLMEGLRSPREAPVESAKPAKPAAAELDSATFTCCGDGGASAASAATLLNEPELLAEPGCETPDPDPADPQRGRTSSSTSRGQAAHADATSSPGPHFSCHGAAGPPTRGVEAEAEGGVRQYQGSCETHDCCLLVGVSVSSDLADASRFASQLIPVRASARTRVKFNSYACSGAYPGFI